MDTTTTAIADELRAKVRLMRELGVSEVETASGHVRRIALGPRPDGAAEPVAEPVKAPDQRVLPSPEEKEAATKAKRERALFGSGK